MMMVLVILNVFFIAMLIMQRSQISDLETQMKVVKLLSERTCELVDSNSAYLHIVSRVAFDAKEGIVELKRKSLQEGVKELDEALDQRGQANAVAALKGMLDEELNRGKFDGAKALVVTHGLALLALATAGDWRYASEYAERISELRAFKDWGVN